MNLCVCVCQWMNRGSVFCLCLMNKQLLWDLKEQPMFSLRVWVKTDIYLHSVHVFILVLDRLKQQQPLTLSLTPPRKSFVQMWYFMFKIICLDLPWQTDTSGHIGLLWENVNLWTDQFSSYFCLFCSLFLIKGNIYSHPLSVRLHFEFSVWLQPQMIDYKQKHWGVGGSDSIRIYVRPPPLP